MKRLVFLLLAFSLLTFISCSTPLSEKSAQEETVAADSLGTVDESEGMHE